MNKVTSFNGDYKIWYDSRILDYKFETVLLGSTFLLDTSAASTHIVKTKHSWKDTICAFIDKDIF